MPELDQTIDRVTYAPARYAKGMIAVVIAPDGSGFKTREQRLAGSLTKRYTNRERAYLMSPRKARLLQHLIRDGYDASVIDGKLFKD